MNVAVIGTGYVGLVTGVCLAEKGHTVVCVDVDQSKLDQIQQGNLPIFEKDLAELLQRNKRRICFTTSYEKACRGAEVIVIGVGTPEMSDGSADLSYVYEAAERIAAYADRDCVVAVKSTVPIGTCDRLEEKIRSRADGNKNIDVVSNPEFLAQGTAVKDTLHASRIVIGYETEKARKVMEKLYYGFKDVPLILTGRRSAEMIKYASNDFLALKISYINEIANLCEEVGADIEAVSEGMGLDYRIGKSFLKAGIGYGGSCFPKDTKALHWLASNHRCELKTVKAAIEVNEAQKIRLIKKLEHYYANLEGKTIAVLGLTFKPGTDDVREAPSLAILPILLRQGARIKAFDPIGIEKFKIAFAKDGFTDEMVEYYDDISATLKDAEACFILTEWPEIAALEEKDFADMKEAIVLDGRNCFSPKTMTHVRYESIGRP